jgi:hypothetical protein
MKYFLGTIKCVAIAVFALISSASNSLTNAADYTIVPKVSAAFTPVTFTPVPLPNINSQVGTPLVYQVDFYINASGFNAGADQRGFGGIVLDINRTAGLGNTSIPGWQPNGAVVDTNGATPGGNAPLWEDNADFGPLDLQDIVANISIIPSPNVADPRPHVGEPPSLAVNNLIGSVYIDWNGLGIQTLTATPEQPSFARISNGQFQNDTGATLHNGVVVFGLIPEPSTITLIGLALPALGIMATRARRKNALTV